MEKNEFIEFLLTRRSIRKFTDEDVPLDLVKRIVDTARFAPSAKNRQPWEFIVVKDRSRLEELSKAYPWAGPLKAAKAAVAVVVDPKTSPVTHLIDGANATMYLLFAAHALGLGGVWINAIASEEMKKILNVPDDKVLLSVVALGWPAEKPEPRPRKNLEEVLHLEEYGRKKI